MGMIEDGRGSGLRASVNSKFRLETETVTFDREDDSIQNGQGFQITSGPVNYTAETESAVLYFKNVEDFDVVLDRVVLMLGVALNSGTPINDSNWTHKILRNPTTGTLVDDAVQAGISNSNHGSANVLNGGTNIYKPSAPGKTLTDGTGVPLPVQPQTNRILFPIGRRLSKNSSFGIVIKPPANTTVAQSVTVCHVFVDQNLVAST